MRFKYYMKLIGQMNYKAFVLLFLILLLVIFSSIIFVSKVIPIIKVTCESYAKAVGIKITEETVHEIIEDVEYNSLITLNYNKEGKISSISANVVELNKLASKIAYEIQDKMNKLEKTTIKVPIGEALGFSIFSGFGPEVDIKLVPMGNIDTKFNSLFTSEGINQTKHTIYINVKSDITIIAPFIGDTVSVERQVTVAETVIIGDTPGTYYNISDLENSNKSGALEIIKD